MRPSAAAQLGLGPSERLVAIGLVRSSAVLAIRFVTEPSCGIGRPNRESDRPIWPAGVAAPAGARQRGIGEESPSRTAGAHPSRPGFEVALSTDSLRMT